MPKINIYDNNLDRPALVIQDNVLSVAIAGLVDSTKWTAAKTAGKVDRNDIITLTSTKDFNDCVGDVVDSAEISVGNEIAKSLLSMGYVVYYKKIATSDELFGATNPFEAFKEKASYDFRFITPGVCSSENITGTGESEEARKLDQQAKYAKIVNYVIEVAHEDATGDPEGGRGDCIALVDIDDAELATYRTTPTKANLLNGTAKGAKVALSTSAGTVKDKNAAIFAPACTYGTKDFPASYFYLCCFANSIHKGYAEWYAAAGEIRGLAGTPDKLGASYGDVAINKLEPRSASDAGIPADLPCAVNLIANFRGNAVMWGNRTATEFGTDLGYIHFLNIRHIVVSLKKTLYQACRRFTFDPNSDILWTNFTNAISPLLERMKANEGIRDYRIVKLETQEKAKLMAKVKIVPIEAVEDFEIEIALDTTLGDATVTA